MNDQHIEDIITSLYDMIQDARALPLGADKCIVEREKVLDMLDEIIAQLPAELKQSRTIVENRNDLISQARHESENILRKAAEEAARMVSQEATTRLSVSAWRWWSRPRFRSPVCARPATSTWKTLFAVLRRLWPRHCLKCRRPAPSSRPSPLPPPLKNNPRILTRSRRFCSGLFLCFLEHKDWVKGEWDNVQKGKGIRFCDRANHSCCRGLAGNPAGRCHNGVSDPQ